MRRSRHSALGPSLSRTDRVLLTAIVLAASVFPVDLKPEVQRAAPVRDGQFSARQGQVVVVPLSVDEPSVEITGRFLGRRIPFFRVSHAGGRGGFLGLVGIDMLDKPGRHDLDIVIRAGNKSRALHYSVLVAEKPFPVQRLTLPKNQVDLDHKTLVRVKAEQAQVRGVFRQPPIERYWTKRFIEPVHGSVAGAFGRKRVINGQPRSPHSGEDISAPMGTEVVSTNDGVVRLVVDHFFSGKGLFVDHGVGVVSMYFHLSEVLVPEGEKVRRGQAIGKVGATGRATGPHLHWGIRMNGARVDPYALTKLPLDDLGQNPALN